MSGSQFAHLFSTWYLRDAECGPVDWDLLAGAAVPAERQPTMPPVSAVAERTFIVAIVYFAVCCVWLLASLGLLCECQETW